MNIETFFAAISSAFVPVMAALILAYGLLHNAPVYDYFIEGAKKGLATALEILPFLIGIYLAVNGLTASGLLQFIYHLLAPLSSLSHVSRSRFKLSCAHCNIIIITCERLFVYMFCCGK